MPRVPLAVSAVLLASAGPPPDDLVRDGNAALRAGDPAAAERLYAAAAERTADPGLVAFDAAAALVARGEFREAELHYVRALDDRAAPPDRRAKAHYNRGVCLLRRADDADDVPALRTAVRCFEEAIGSPAADDRLRADARHNLELAKLLWNRARSREAHPPRPNELPPDAAFDPAPPQPEPDGPDAGPEGASRPAGADPQAGGRPDAAAARPGGPDPQPTPQPSAGHGTLPVLNDDAAAQPLSPADARAYLERLAGRLDRDRRAGNRLKAGPERPHVPDW